MPTPNFLPLPDVKYTKKSNILGEFQVKVHPSLVQDKMAKAFQRLQQKVTLPGFRPGKAPIDLVKARYRKDVLDDVFQEVANEAYRKGATDNKVPAVGDPYITKANFDAWTEGAPVEFTAQVDLIPEVTVKKYKGLPITKKEASITDDDVEIVLKNLLDPKAAIESLPEGTKVKKGHFVTIDFEGSLDGQPLADASATNFFLEVGGEGSLEDFQKGLEGMTAGGEKTITVKYDAEYKNASIAGKSVDYKVKLHEVKEKTYPPLTDEIAKEFQAENAADLRGKIRENLEAEMNAEQENRASEEVLLALLEANELEVPPSLIQRQLRHIFSEMAEMLKRQKYNDKLIEDYFHRHFDEFKQRAEREVRVALMLPKIVELEKIEAAEADFQDHFDRIVKQSGQKLEQVEKFFSENAARKEELTREIQRRKALRFLVDNAKVAKK
ncbi:MAG: trigger factor [Bdellovibrionales bacterium]|nr:trigger factor [Bdellovibrionales bacterium]